MIDENRCRAELSPSERAAQTARRKAIYLELHPETAEHVAGGKGNATAANFAAVPAFATATAEATGKLNAPFALTPSAAKRSATKRCALSLFPPCHRLRANAATELRAEAYNSR